MLKGWPRKTARMALSRARHEQRALPGAHHLGGPPPTCHRASAESGSRPRAPSDSAPPTGGFHRLRKRARNASSSFCESCCRRALRACRATAVSLSVSPVAAWRCGVALVEQRLHLARIELRLVFGVGGCFGGVGGVGLLRLRLLLLGLLGVVLLERVGDQIALRLGFLLGRFLLGLRRRRRRRRIGRRGDFLAARSSRPDCRPASARRSSRRTASASPAWARRHALRHLAGAGIGDDVDRQCSRHASPAARVGAKLTSAAPRTTSMAARRYGPVRPQRPYLLSCSGMTSILAPKPAALMRPNTRITSE